jgi:DNA-binding IclR family transcriptional regulator
VGTGAWNHTGKIVAAISASAATLPNCRRLKGAERPLMSAAAEIHRRLGWMPTRQSGPERLSAPA